MDSSELLNQVIKSGNFSFVDWVIVSIYLLASLAIGLYANKFVGGLSDYVVAGRKLGTALSIATVTGTELGLITVMYSAQKGFNGGFAAFHIALIAGIVTFLVGWSGFLMARLRETKAMTIPEYYEIRFGRKVRVLGGILLAAGGVLNMGIFLQVGAKFIVGATGLDPQGNTLIFVMIILLGLVLTYTILGGMISVVITDYIQFVVLSFGLVLTVGLVLMTQSFDQMVDVVSSSKGEAGFNPVVADSGFGSTYMVW
jgi:SSS family solute:Na+ symporter